MKAQVPTGKRGKAGGIRKAATAAEAAAVAKAILGMELDGYAVEKVLIEERADIAREFYAAVLTDFAARRPLILFSTEGGMDIEEVATARPDAIRRHSLDIDQDFDASAAQDMLAGLALGSAEPKIAGVLSTLYNIYRECDAELVEINPLALLKDGSIVALDCKFTLDDSAVFRQSELAASGAQEMVSALERRGAEVGLKFIELGGNVGVLANGAGLTMTTMDVIAHFGGKPVNFLEIGGELYTKAETALGLVLAAGNVKSLVINFTDREWTPPCAYVHVRVRAREAQSRSKLGCVLHVGVGPGPFPPQLEVVAISSAYPISISFTDCTMRRASASDQGLQPTPPPPFPAVAALARVNLPGPLPT